MKNAKKHWKFRADISRVVNHITMGQEEKADRIWHIMYKLPPFRSDEHRTVLTDLMAAAKLDLTKFEEKLDTLYNFCDYYRIWLSV